jgi:chromate reductase, NAD(P)H dehydrogenase (quinone)
MSAPKILAFAGSTRKESYNKKLIQIAAAGARNAGAEVMVLDLRDLPLPLYDGDLEEAEGLPKNALELKKIFFAHQGLLISSPEYNSSVSGVLKNTIDWVSRPATKEEGSLACFDKKVAGLVSASPGALGGLRGLVHLRSILGNIKVLVIPNQVAVSHADEAFLPDGKMKDERKAQSIQKVGADVAELLIKLYQK